jgi:DNA polymerase-3 subunit alpha
MALSTSILHAKIRASSRLSASKPTWRRAKHTDKDPHLDKQKNTHHLTLWAKNLTGYKKLVKLTTRAHLDGFYYRPRVDHELIAKHSEG